MQLEGVVVGIFLTYTTLLLTCFVPFVAQVCVFPHTFLSNIGHVWHISLM